MSDYTQEIIKNMQLYYQTYKKQLEEFALLNNKHTDEIAARQKAIELNKELGEILAAHNEIINKICMKFAAPELTAPEPE